MFGTLNSEKRFFCEKKNNHEVERKNSICHRKYLVGNFVQLEIQLYKIGNDFQ